MRLILGALIVLLLLLQYEFWFSDGGMRTVWHMQQNISKQQQINDQLDKRNQALIAQVKDLQSGNAAVEAHARNDLGMIQKGVVVLHAQDHWWSTLQLQYPEKVLTTVGGKARVDSVLLGLSFLRDFASKNDWVMVHDAARPFITTDDITSFMHELGDHEVGGLLGLPVVDTLKKVRQ